MKEFAHCRKTAFPNPMPFPYPIMQFLHNVKEPYAAGFSGDAFCNSSPTAFQSARINA
ncbi:hypothetical protein AWB75_05439 [Caballeronia catudaia]|uniref:Uncharacterized protein n=1 Tax=Caballeronia catudaia TaxID=1777136 RepID=A0A158CMY7_9BURK|nr:hypothetical protein AWB75_05439 [Caballeronia catudaia]